MASGRMVAFLTISGYRHNSFHSKGVRKHGTPWAPLLAEWLFFSPLPHLHVSVQTRASSTELSEVDLPMFKRVFGRISESELSIKA